MPISLYREVSAELQAARTMLDSLHNQNQQLTRQNQQLRVEIERVVQVSLRLRQVADSFQPSNRGATTEADYTPPEVPDELPPPSGSRGGRPGVRHGNTRHHPETESAHPAANSRSGSKNQPSKPDSPDPTLLSEELFTGQEEGQYNRGPKGEQGPDFNGWWLAIVILLIVVSAFGAGFLIVRPFLPSR
ncbi:hypothetical protein [Leptolyngbya sp. 'hensonii']|uniref:hypothetical protein n=1 Tax=Leptolyngbya sp. 'hensonii' TaxID=1922337 RepID=UPI0015C5605F|nr:hypothetical protein [Leptolyngbya sp. 'hensonii']